MATPRPQPSDKAPAKCYLLSIPPELRDAIWKLAISQGEIITPESRYLRVNDFRACESALALALTCGQVFLEIFPVFYSGNVFNFYHAADVCRFLGGIGSNRKQFIKSIIFHFIGDEETVQRAAELLYLCPNLQTLEVCLRVSFRKDEKNLLQKAKISSLRGVRGCREVEVTAGTADVLRSPILWDCEIEGLSKVLKEELCRERSPLDKLSPGMLAAEKLAAEKLAAEQVAAKGAKRIKREEDTKKQGRSWQEALRPRKR